MLKRASSKAPRDAEEHKYKLALLQTALIVTCAGMFAACVFFGLVPHFSTEDPAANRRAAMDFLSCYLIEASLSLDNLFAFFLVFKYFAVDVKAQTRVLRWGICGAMVLRALMIGVGAVLVNRFQGILLLFSAILMYQGFKLAVHGDDDDDDEDLGGNKVVRLAQWLLPVSSKMNGDRFFVREGPEGKLKATPLLLVLVIVEFSDIVFAVDSVPAAFGVTKLGWVIFAANMFDIAALRSLYPIIAHLVNDMPDLQKAVGVVLCFVGGKIFADFLGFHVSTSASLVCVGGILSCGVASSVRAMGAAPSPRESSV